MDLSDRRSGYAAAGCISVQLAGDGLTSVNAPDPPVRRLAAAGIVGGAVLPFTIEQLGSVFERCNAVI